MSTQTSEKLQAETACELHFAIDIFGPPFTIKRGPYATLLSVCRRLSAGIGELRLNGARYRPMVTMEHKWEINPRGSESAMTFDLG